MTSFFNLFIDNNQYNRCKIFILCVLFSLLLIDVNAAPPVESQVSNELLEVCTTAECVRSATELRTAMNISVDPCDDFYEFTCGRWSTEHPIQKGYTQSSLITLGKQKQFNDVLKFLKSSGTEDEPTALRKTRDMFRSCMDQEPRESLGYDVIFKYLPQLGLPAVPRFFNLSDSNEDIKDYKFDWMKTDSTFHALLRVPLFVSCEVEKNMFESSQNINKCKIPDRKFRFYDLDLSDEETEKLFDVEIYSENQTAIQEAWQKLTNFTITTLIKKKYDLPADFQERFDAAIEVIKKIETQIANVKNVAKNEAGNFNLQLLDDVQFTTNNFKPSNKGTHNLIWEQYLEASFSSINLTVDLNDEEDVMGIGSRDLSYYTGINAIVMKTSAAELELWAWWRSVLNLIIHTTSDASQYVEEILKTSDIKNELSREIVCTRLTTYRMDYAAAHILTNQLFQKITKPKVQEILNNINEAFEMRVNDLEWMDAETKNLTIEKSKTMKSVVGYPEWLENKTMLDNFYAPVPVNADTYLDNLIGLNKFKRKRNLEEFFLVKNEEWPRLVNVMKINAYYSPSNNAMAIPFAIIKYLFYNHGLEALNYGATGAVVGHELTHGFDNEGRLFDKTGTFKQWWSNSTSLEFSKMSECFVDQYNQYYVPESDAYVNGTLTLPENLADNGGVHHAYLAYQNQKKKNEEKLRLPGLEQFTNDQLFFMSYANFWCSKSQTNQMKDVHCPNKFRVIGNFMNSEEFSTAFNCPLGTNMNPKKSKCKIW